MQNAWIWIVVLVVIVVGGFIWWQSSQTPSTDVNLTPQTENTNTVSTTDTSTTTTSNTTASTTNAGGAMTGVTYDPSSGFSPATVTVKKGSTVTWTEQGASNMWVATGPHPAHTGYDGDSSSRSTHCAPGYSGPTPFDQCAPGGTYSFTFDAVGTWPYHDHMNASKFGKIVVVE